MHPREATDFIHTQMPLCAMLGVNAEVMEPTSVVLTLEWGPQLCTGGGMLHGGTLMALADSAGGVLAFLNLPEGATGTSTIASATNFLGAVRQGRVSASASLLHGGRSTIVVETVVSDATGRRVAKVTQTQSVLRPTGA